MVKGIDVMLDKETLKMIFTQISCINIYLPISHFSSSGESTEVIVILIPPRLV